MHSVRRAAFAASSLAIAPAIRPQIARSRALHTTLRTTRWKPQPASPFVSAVRTYVSEPENAATNAAESVKDAASQAGESLKGTAEATREFASEVAPDTSATDAASQAKESVKGTTEATEEFAGQAASDVEDVTQQASETAQATTSTATENLSETAQDAAQDAAAAMPISSPAPSTQASPIRAQGIKEGAKPSHNLYIGNLYFEVSEKALREEFSRFGEVKNVKVIYDGRGLSKGFGYVEFENVDQATAALEALDQQIFEGRRLAVQYAIAQAPRAAPTKEHGFRHAPSRTLYIGNMSYEMSDKDLNDLFREIKNVTDVRVAIDRRTGQPRGYAHADFLDVDSATKAADHLKSKTFYGRTLRVDYTHSKTTARPSASDGA